MGLLQPHGRYGRGDGQAIIITTVVIHGLQDALTALAEAQAHGKTIDLITAHAASAYIGAGLFAAITAEIRRAVPDGVGRILYDCGPHRGHVLSGLRVGLREFCLDEDALTPALYRLCEEQGALLIPRPENCSNLVTWLPEQKKS